MNKILVKSMGHFTDNSQGATIPTKNLESAMNEANTVPGWHVNSNDRNHHSINLGS